MATTGTICPSCGHKNLEGADACSNCGSPLTKVDLPKPASRVEQTVMQLPLTALEMSVVHSIPPDTTLEDAVQTLNRQKIDILEVVEDGRLIGLLSVRDIVMRVGPNYRDKLSRPVREFMTPKIETLPPDAPITFAINKMDVGGYRHVPVVQHGKMVGVVSSRDVIRYLIKQGRLTVATANRTTSHGVSPA